MKGRINFQGKMTEAIISDESFMQVLKTSNIWEDPARRVNLTAQSFTLLPTCQDGSQYSFPLSTVYGQLSDR